MKIWLEERGGSVWLMGQDYGEPPHWEARFDSWEMALRVFPKEKIKKN